MSLCCAQLLAVWSMHKGRADLIIIEGPFTHAQYSPGNGCPRLLSPCPAPSSIPAAWPGPLLPLGGSARVPILVRYPRLHNAGWPAVQTFLC